LALNPTDAAPAAVFFTEDMDFSAAAVSHSDSTWLWSRKRVILNVAAHAETTVNMFHSLDRDMALQSEKRFRRAGTLPRNTNLALQAFASFEALSSDAVESFAAEIFGSTFNRQHSSLSVQTYGPMHWKPLAFAAVTG